MYDSSGNDLFISQLGSAVLSGVKFQNTAANFERVNVAGTPGGQDIAHFHLSDSRVEFIGKESSAQLIGDQQKLLATEFSSVFLHAMESADDMATVSSRIELTAVDYAFELLGA